jgi:dihydroxyacetone kinase-like predicted kinase
MLAALREAGVVDAGGHALTVIFAGVVAALRNETPPELEHYAPAKITHPEHSSSTYRYCTNFAVTGSHLIPSHFTPTLERLGDSVLVVGDLTTLKVHLHTDEPERATALFADAGEVSHLDVADMRLQVAERDERLRQAGLANGGGLGAGGPAGARVRVRCGALAVVNGPGLTRMYRELGVYTIDGGPTLNPSTYELLAGIHEVPAEEVVVLPGSANVVMAAERAAALSDKHVLVVPATSQQAGLAVAVALQGERSGHENARARREALEALRKGAVAQAASADAPGPFQAGEAVGFIEDEVVAWGEPRATLLAVLRALAADAELVSVLAGAQAPLELEQIGAMMDGEVELELRDGGQPSYWWLLAAE